MRSSKKLQTYLPLACLAMFIFISVLSWREQLVFFDSLIIESVAGNVSPAFVLIMEELTRIGSGETILILTFLLSLLLLYKKLWKEIIFLYALTIGGILLNFLLKVAFQRERPGEMNSIDVFGYSLEIASYSFPSGHTMRSVLLFSFLIYISYGYLGKKTTRAAVVSFFIAMIFLIALSRVVIGAHFPTDIFAAITLSISWFYFCLRIVRYKNPDRLR